MCPRHVDLLVADKVGIANDQDALEQVLQRKAIQHECWQELRLGFQDFRGSDAVL